MRSLAAALLGLAAVLLTAVALPALWTERNVVDEDGYVALTAPLGSDREFQAALGEVVTESVLGASRVPSAARPAIGEAAGTLPRIDGYEQAWRESNRLSHRATFGDAAELPASQDHSNRLVVDLAPLATLVVDRVNETAGTQLSAPSHARLTVGGSSQQSLVEDLQRLDPLAFVVGAGALVLALLSVWSARSRGAALGWLGFGALVVAGVLKAVAEVAVPEVMSRNTPPSQAAMRLQTLLQDAAMSSFDRWLIATVVVGVLLVVVGAVMAIVARRRSS